MQVEMSSSMVQGLVSSGSGPLALENPAFLDPDLGAQGRLEKRQKQLPTWQSSQMNYLAGSPRDGGGRCWEGLEESVSFAFRQGGCGAFQRRLGGVSVAGAASGGSRHQEMALGFLLRPQGRGLGRLGGWHQIVYDTVNLSSLISLLK